MSTLISFFTGQVTFRLEGGNQAAFFRLCKNQKIPLSQLRARRGVLSVRLPAGAYRRLRPVARRTHCRCRIQKKTGLPFLLWPYRKRIGFFGGALLFLLLLLLFGGRLWVVEVEGNQLVSTAEILAVAKENGIRPGDCPPADRFPFLEQKMLRKLDSLSWLALNKSGSRMKICVTERTMPLLPKEERRPMHLVADTDGVLLEQNVYRGVPTLQPGQPFVKGDILVSAYIYGTNAAQSVCASAKIVARVDRSFTVALPMRESRAVVQKKQTRALRLYCFSGVQTLGRQTAPYEKSETRSTFVTLDFLGERLPFRFERICYIEKKEETVTRTAEQVRVEGIWRVNDAIQKTLGEEGRLEQIRWRCRTEKNTVLVTAETTLILPVGVLVPAEETPPAAQKEPA